MEAQKPIAQPKKADNKQGSNVAGIKNAFLVILACLVVAVLLFMFWFGHESHFE
ncbi:MAG: MotA/TolQ/ExbB proton channel family protein, partial [Muribaculaceae bacterium]|nr:MotA/TolQ/ExbB proton channel family protein [Muribaculaceae bacterium]